MFRAWLGQPGIVARTFGGKIMPGACHRHGEPTGWDSSNRGEAELKSPASSYITGAQIVIDGGSNLGNVLD
jgi:hypothetical protein